MFLDTIGELVGGLNEAALREIDAFCKIAAARVMSVAAMDEGYQGVDDQAGRHAANSHAE